MSTSDRRPYLSATVLDQELLDDSADNLSHRLEMIAKIETPNRTIYVSDRAKFVDNVYYAPKVIFPSIKRTVGEWLAGSLQFESLEISINNADEEYNDILPGGDDYDGFVGTQITVSVGLGEIGTTYTVLFKGKVTEDAGFQRSHTEFTLIARSNSEVANQVIPVQTLNDTDFPDIEDEFKGLSAPIIYGDWTTSLELKKLDPDDVDSDAAAVGHVPAFPVNGANVAVNKALDDPSAGDTDLRLVISGTPISVFTTSEVYLLRGNKYFKFDVGDITIVPSTDNTVFDIEQKNLTIDGKAWIYENGDNFFVKVKGVDLGAYDDNLVAQAKDILLEVDGVTSFDIDDTTWDAFRDKASPSVSDITSIKSRVWLQDPQPAFEYVLSMLEQVRLEAFVNRYGDFALTSLHFDEFGNNFDPDTNFKIRNWDIVKDSMKPNIDELNNFNRAKADFDFNPAKGENRLSTLTYKNDAAVTQAGGRKISKLITFPNLYILSQVVAQLGEIIKLASATSELIDIRLNLRAFLLDIGDFVTLNIDIGSINYTDQPAVLRDAGYDPEGPSIIAKLWNFQLVNFPPGTGIGHTGPAGTVGGFDAVITED
jgi:hypothetical protein